MGIVVTAGDPAAHLDFRELEFVFPECGAGENIMESAEHFIGAFFESGKRNRAVAFADLAFDGCGDVFEIFIELIAGLCGSAAAADHGAGDAGESDLIGGVEEIAGTDQREAADEGEFVILEKIELAGRWEGWLLRLSVSGFPLAAGI